MEDARTTYYAILTDDGRPVGLVRRIHLSPRPRDEILARDLTWQLTEFLKKYSLGHMDEDYVEISDEDAQKLIENWRSKREGGDN